MFDERYIGVEVEYLTSLIDYSTPLTHDGFRSIWARLVERGWDPSVDSLTRCTTGVSRSTPRQGCLRPAQALSTDTGPTFEIATAPETNLYKLRAQLNSLTDLMNAELAREGAGAFQMGVHPLLGSDRDSYLAWRTPRAAYDYARFVRGWPHERLLNIAAIHEVIDVSSDDAMTALRCLIRLAGLQLFMFRNAPDVELLQQHPDDRQPLPDGFRYCVRPDQWLAHVTTATPQFVDDCRRVNLPEPEWQSWNDYFTTLWTQYPMFFVGTKKDGLFSVKGHPTFLEFLSQSSWVVQDFAGNSREVVPDIDHVNTTDWHAFYVCRPRWQLESSVTIPELLDAFHTGAMDELMRTRALKICLENRVNPTSPPGQELSSAALLLGLLQNLATTVALVDRYDYRFWQRVFLAAQTVPLLTARVDGVRILPLLAELIQIATIGLKQRGLGEELFLAPVRERVEFGLSPSEEFVYAYRQMAGSHEDRIHFLMGSRLSRLAVRVRT